MGLTQTDVLLALKHAEDREKGHEIQVEKS